MYTWHSLFGCLVHTVTFAAALTNFAIAGYNYYTLSHVKRDKLNPVSGAKDLNEYYIVEVSCVSAMILLPLTTGEFLAFVLGLPLGAFLYLRFHQKKHKIDPTELYQYETRNELFRDGKLKLTLATVLFMAHFYYFIVNTAFPFVEFMIYEFMFGKVFGNLGRKIALGFKED
uniref:Uncharacterized protein n=1 Tax=Aplanochytrium stocchinoi TaxID=215587 RepID=A0A7S3LHN0_9STRA|mmetsp:Transcript_12432/g.15418  ORF Transcript_12432/g.15418 Transcript_12432/m.15418 type:complete len:172 (+) Transcript_12432:235-750(+)